MKTRPLISRVAAALLAPALLLSCRQDGRPGEGMSLRLVLTPADGGEVTKAADGILIGHFDTGDRLYGYFPDGKTTVESAIFTIRDARGEAVSNPVGYVLDEYYGEDVRVHAYYPSSVNQNTGSWTVALDQRDGDAYKGGDLMYGTALLRPQSAEAAEDGSPELVGHVEMIHRMARLKLVLRTESPAGSGDLVVEDVRLLQGCRSVDIATPLTSMPGSSVSDPVSAGNPIRVWSGTYSLTDGNPLVCAALLPPNQTLSTGDILEVDIRTGVGTGSVHEGTVTYRLTDPLTLATGKEHSFTLPLAPLYLNRTVDINAWAEESLTPVDGPRYLTFRVGDVEFRMVYVEGGDYTTLGGKAVTGSVSDFYLAETETTMGLYKAVMGSNPSQYDQYGDRYPLGGIKQKDYVSGIIATLNTLTDPDTGTAPVRRPRGWVFSLPSSVQWEWAAREGIRRSSFSWAGSDDIDEVCWYSGAQKPGGTGTVGAEDIQPVALKRPNALGLYDMSGNVWEVCADATWTVTAGADYGLDYVNLPADPAAYSGNVVYRSGAVNQASGSGSLKVSGHYLTSQQMTVRNGMRLALIKQ